MWSWMMQNPIWKWNEKCNAKLSDFLSAEAKKAIFRFASKQKLLKLKRNKKLSEKKQKIR